MPRDTDQDPSFQEPVEDREPPSQRTLWLGAFVMGVVGAFTLGVLYLTFKFVFLPIFTQ